MVDSQWNIKAPSFTSTSTTAPQFVGTSTNTQNTLIDNTNPTSQTTYYPTFVTGNSNQRQRINNGLQYISLNGTTSALGTAYLRVGNSTASGTAGNKKGFIQLYGQNTGRSQIEYANSTSSVTQVMPAVNGTFVVKQSASITTETNGWYKVNMGAYTHYFKNGQIPSQSYNSNGWGWLSGTWLKLPSGVTFNSAKMIFSGALSNEDSAILYNFNVSNGATSIAVCYNNKYSAVLTKVGYYSFSLIVFP